MKAILKLIFATSMLLLTSCAQIVKKDYAPTRGGTVKYSTAWFMAEKNREKALEEMRGYCGAARPRIMSEDSKREFTGGSTSNSNSSGDSTYTSTHQESEGVIYLHFKCVANPKRLAKSK